MDKENYTGPERRRNQIDHDLLIRIDEKITTFGDSFTKHLREDSDFAREMREKISSIDKWRWQIVGATGLTLVIVELVTRVIFK